MVRGSWEYYHEYIKSIKLLDYVHAFGNLQGMLFQGIQILYDAFVLNYCMHMFVRLAWIGDAWKCLSLFLVCFKQV